MKIMLFDIVANHQNIPVILIGITRQFLGYRVLVSHFQPTITHEKHTFSFFSFEDATLILYCLTKRQAKDP